MVVVDDRLVVAILAGNNFLKVILHLAELACQDFQSLRPIAHLLGESALAGVLDISEQVLDTNFLSLCSANTRRNMDELATNVAILVNLLTREVCCRGQTNLRRFFNFADEKDWHGVVATEDLIDLDVVLL